MYFDVNKLNKIQHYAVSSCFNNNLQIIVSIMIGICAFPQWDIRMPLIKVL